MRVLSVFSPPLVYGSVLSFGLAFSTIPWSLPPVPTVDIYATPGYSLPVTFSIPSPSSTVLPFVSSFAYEFASPPPDSTLHPWLKLGGNLRPLHPSLFSLNIKNFVTIVLSVVEDFLSWRTQFIAFLVTQQLSGFFDGTIETPLNYVLDVHGIQHPNPMYSVWLQFVWINLFGRGCLLLFLLNY